jgi:hypothetical protein
MRDNSIIAYHDTYRLHATRLHPRLRPYRVITISHRDNHGSLLPTAYTP